MNRILRIGPKTFCTGFPETFHLEKPVHLDLVIHNPIVIHIFHNSHSIFVIDFSLFFWQVPLFRPFICLFINLVMREQTLVPCLTSRFSFIELTFGRMPTLTRRSRASTFQIVSTWLSKNDTRILLLPLILLFLDTFRPRVIDAQKVWRHLDSVFLLGTIVNLMPETALVSLRTLAFSFPLIM